MNEADLRKRMNAASKAATDLDARIHEKPVSKIEQEAREKRRSKPKLVNVHTPSGTIPQEVHTSVEAENERRINFIKKRLERQKNIPTRDFRRTTIDPSLHDIRPIWYHAPMTDFLTEKQTEDLLAPETNTITLPSGKLETIRATKLFWIRLDLLIKANIITMKRLIELSHINQQDMGYNFDDAFQSVVTYVDQRAG